jgi:PAS domain S-box-containing protein
VAEVLRSCVIDRRIYRHMNAETGISKEIKSREELSVAWRGLREEGQKTGVIEAVYKIALRKGSAIWLKDQATIETLGTDRICLSPGLLTNVSKEMEAEDELEKHRDQLEAVVQARTAELTKLNEQLKLEIVERRLAEKVLRESKERYRMVADFTYDWEYWLSPDQDLLYCSPACERITGYRAEEFEKDPDLLLAITHPDDRHRIGRYIDDTTSPDHESDEMEFRIVTRSGEVRWIAHVCRRVHSREGASMGRRASNRDITKRKRAEQEKEELEMQLRQAQKMEAIATLAGGIAHDFNNILAIIMGNAEITKLKLTEDSPAKKDIDIVLKAAHRGRDLVNQIVTFSRMIEQKPKPLQIIPLIKQVMKLFRAILPSSVEIRQEIELALGDDLILADSTQIHQLVMNLVTNAAHAMREQGGMLTVTLSCVDFDSGDTGKAEKHSPGKFLKLTVEDTGHGMDRATIERIFDPYFTTKSPGEGTGLGLAVVQGIVKSHRGEIQVYSEPEKGAAFHVYFPKLESGDTSKAKALNPIPMGSERILLVDDEEELVNASKEMLEHLGYKVSTTTSSLDALDLFRQQVQQFDLVITDYSLPRMTGVDLAREMMNIRPDVAIILVTGFNERITEKQARDMGISAFVMKPFTFLDFAEIVRRVLDKG